MEGTVRQISKVEVPGDERLWKYFKLERFIAALNSGQLYFAAAHQFVDPFEGAVAVQMNVPLPDPRYAEMEALERAFFQLKRLTKVSCWHRAGYESDAMWKLYAGQHKGIAVCTTPDRIRAAFKPFRLKPEYGHEDLWAGPVEYLDLTQVRLKGVTMLGRFFIKHRAFEWEREFRLAISLRTAEEFAVKVPVDGILVDVDFATLVDQIVLGSTTTADQRALVTEHVKKAGLGGRLHVSTLLGKPRYI